MRIDINDFTFSGGEFNLTWTVVSLAPVVQYHLQYRQIEVDLFFYVVVIVEGDGDRAIKKISGPPVPTNIKDKHKDKDKEIHYSWQIDKLLS